MAIEETNEWICSTVDVEGGIRPGSKIKPVMRGMAAKDLRWDKGQTLKIYFDNGDQSQHQKFMDIANLWIIDGVSLKLETTNTKKESHIRVYIGGDKNLSLVGTQSMSPTVSGQPTLWVSNVTDSIVLHEFGHALGLVHEHFHSDLPFTWNKEAVYKDLGEFPNQWKPDYIDRHVFKIDPEKKLPLDEEVTEEFDPLSVMMYTVKASWTIEKKSFMPGRKLSNLDIETILTLYRA